MSAQRATEERTLAKHARAIVAMRKAYEEKRFGLVLGSGVSKAFQFEVPSWDELLNRIASHDDVGGEAVDQKGATPTSRADVLYRHFEAQRREKLEVTPINSVSADAASTADISGIKEQIGGEWRAIIREILYEKSPVAEQLGDQHPYLSEFLDIVVRTPMTITYNFDSYLETMLAVRGSRLDKRGRDYETVFDDSVPFRSNTGVIYHPNGYLPQNVLERSSDALVFSEEEFGDQLLQSIAGRYSSLAHHLSKSVCLFIGLSLADENLRHFLRRNATINPGHYHYILEYIEHEDAISQARRQALFDYRYSVYNLITLFLTNDQIAAIGRMIRCDSSTLYDIADTVGVPTKYVYYLTGIPGIGKTTVLRHMASLTTYDEWMTDPNPLLAKPHKDLSKEERNGLDDWVAKQFYRKNDRLVNEEEGVFVVERAPLDPISFASEEDIPQKARWYHGKIAPFLDDRMCEGSVIFLWGDVDKVSKRVIGRQSEPQPPEYLERLQNTLKDKIYNDSSVRDLQSTGFTIPELVREVARIVHLEDYRPVNLQQLLDTLEHNSKDDKSGSA